MRFDPVREARRDSCGQVKLEQCNQHPEEGRSGGLHCPGCCHPVKVSCAPCSDVFTTGLCVGGRWGGKGEAEVLGEQDHTETKFALP